MSQSSYHASLRRSAILYWIGLISKPQFESSISIHIKTGFEDAYASGQKTIGISKDERTFQETILLMTRTVVEQSRIPGLSDLIEMRTKEKGFPFSSVAHRVQMWANRWLELYNDALLTGTKDPKLKWVRGPTEKGCVTCTTLNGHVHRASVWKASGISPQSKSLKCGGWNCLCSWIPTTDRGTPGRIPTSVFAANAHTLPDDIGDDPHWWKKYITEEA